MPNLKAKEYKKFEDIKYIRKNGSEYWSTVNNRMPYGKRTVF